MLSGRDIVCLSSLPYRGRPTSRHHLTRELARAGNRVLFVDPWASALRSVSWHRGRVHDEGGGVNRFEPPPHLPWRSRAAFRLFTGWNQRRYAEAVSGAVERLDIRRPILWNSFPVYPSPQVAPLLRPAVHFLHMTDLVWDFPQYRKEYEQYLRAILATADFAVGATPEITSRLAEYGVSAYHLPHGVDVDHFAPVARGELPPRPGLAGLPRPRVGFVGRIDRRLDVAVVRALAAGRGTTILVGPQRRRWAELDGLTDTGCVVIDEVPYSEVPSVLASFDIALLPYRDIGSVRASRPLKTLEYLAAGLPVVASDIPATQELGSWVHRASSPSEFADAVDDLWSARDEEIFSPDRRRARANQVAGQSWASQARQLAEWISSADDANDES